MLRKILILLLLLITLAGVGVYYFLTKSFGGGRAVIPEENNIGGQLEVNPAENLPESNPFKATELNPFEDAYKNPFD